MGKRVFVVVSAVLFGAFAPPAHADRDFTTRFSTNDTGDIAIAAAPLMTCSTTGTNGGQCANARTQTAANGPAGSAQIATQNNNNYTMEYVRTDPDPAITTNSSTAQLNLPAGATVLFAALYWGADQSAGNNNGQAPPAGTPSAGSVKFKVPGGTFQTLTAQTLDFGTVGNAQRYQGFRNVTTEVAAAGSGTYAAGDVRAGTGGDRFAGWSLVVAYRDPAQPARNLTIFDGYKSIASNAAPTTISVSGFRTPPAGPVRTTLGFISYEGDLGLGGDTATLNTTTLGNAANQATNFFNSSISRAGSAVATRNPSYPNALGYDSDLFNADGVLANDATDAAIRLTTSADQYLPGVVTFATELYAPAITLDKSVTNLTHPGGPDQRGDVLRYTVNASNTGQDGADDFVLTDPIPAGTTYVPGSLRLLTGAGSPASPTDGAGDDRAEFATAANRVVFRLGTGATAVLGGRLAAGASSSLSFDVRIGDVQPRFSVLNTADASFVSQSLGLPLTGRSNTVENVVAAPDLTLTKQHAPEFLAGASTTFRIIVSNVGNLVTDGTTVTVTDSFDPAAFASVSNPAGDGWTCSLAGLDLTCTRSGPLAAGASFPPILVDGVVRTDAPAGITNTAVVAGGGDVNPDNNTATDVGGTAQAADIQLTKIASPGRLLSGQTVIFTLVARNAGPSIARGVIVEDTLPAAAYSGVTATTTRGTCTVAVRCNVGDLAPGESATVTIEATVVANDTTLTNTASANSTTPGDPDPGNNTASADVVVDNTADLRITKTPSTVAPVPGAPGGLTYSVVVTNDGPGAATAVVVADDLPTDFTPTVINAPAGFICNAPGAGGQLVCTGASLAAAASVTITVTGTVAAAPVELTLVNTVRVRSATADPDLTNNDDAVTVRAVPLADLAVTKEWGTFDPGPPPVFTPISTAQPGNTRTIRLTATNLGPSPATGVVLSDPLPAGATYSSDDQAACTAAGNTVTCAIGAMAAGATFQVLVTVTIQPGAAGTTLVNTATVDGNQADPVGANDTATDNLAVGNAADLALAKLAQPTAVVGEAVTYTLTVTNNGPSAAQNVSISDPLPAGLTFVSSAACTEAAGTLTCPLGTVAAGAVVSVTFVARPSLATAGTSVRNAATVSSTTQDPDPTNNTGIVRVEIAPQTDLSIVKVASAATVNVDEDVTYTLTVANGGPNDATGVTVVDTVPAGMRFISAPGCAFDAAAGTVTCAVGDLANGASVDLTVTLRPTAALAGVAVVANNASVSGDQLDVVPGNNRDQAAVAVNPEADLSIVKTAGAPTVLAGSTLTYTLVVENAGPSTAADVVVTDTLPAGVVLVSATPSAGACSGAVTCALGPLAPGGSVRIAIVVSVPAAAGGATLENTATVASPTHDPRNVDNTSSVSTPVTTLPPQTSPPDVPTVVQPAPVPVVPAQETTRLTLRKTASRSRAASGTTITFRITVRNRGTATALRVRVCDRLPSGLTFVSAPGARLNGRQACWTITRLGARASRTFTLRARTDVVSRARRITNTATADGANTASTRGRARVLIDPSGVAPRPGGVTG